jgi:hypothetical protein
MTATGSKKSGPPYKLALEGFPASSDFHPLGIAVWTPIHAQRSTEEDVGLSAFLFVVNHQRSRSTIEIFTLRAAYPTVAVYVRGRMDVYLSYNRLSF